MANTLNLGDGNWATKEGSLLGYNSENKNFKPLPFDFSRGSTATRVNKDGLIETVGANEPRIDFKDDSKGALKLEPSRSNVLHYSSDFSQWSTASGASVVGNKLGVGGSNDAFEFFSDGTSSTRLFYAVSITGESSYSLFAKKNTLDYISLYANDDSNARVWFNLDNGTLGNQEGGGTGVIEDYGNGWYRCTLKWTSSNLVNVRIYNSNENDVVGGTAGSVYIQYAQLEQGSYATSYIPTQGSAVTRLADTCSQTVPDGVIGQPEGTMYVETTKWVPSNNGRIFAISDGTTSNYISIIQNTTFSNYAVYIAVGGVTQLAYTETQEIPDNSKIAISYKQNDFAISVNGEIVHTDTSGNVPTVSKIYLGSRENGSYTYYSSNPIKEAKLYNTRLSNSELQALTQV